MNLSIYPYLYGLIGYPLSHSFSKKYFSEKFSKENIEDSFYELFPIENIEQLPELIATYPNLIGLNVTIPYKKAVIPYMDELESGAARVGAVNTIKIKGKRLIGFNSDVYGFKASLLNAFQKLGSRTETALVLGTGGAAKAVAYVLEQLDISYRFVSRRKGLDRLTYEDVDQSVLDKYHLIINTTPLGMSPNVDNFPSIPFHFAGPRHLFFDLVYNPEQTTFLRLAAAQGAATQNGLEMLYFQAEKSWQFWQS